MFLLELSRARNIALPRSGSVLWSVLPLLSTDGEDPLRKWPTIGWGRLLMAGWLLNGVYPGTRLSIAGKRRKKSAWALKKKRASEASVVSGETIFFLFDPVFPLFLPRSCIFNRVSKMGRIFWGFKGQISQESSLLQWDHNSLKNHTSVTLTCDPAVLLPFFFGKKKESLIAGYSNPH